MASESTKTITIKVDLVNGQPTLRVVQDLGKEVDKLSNSQDHNTRIQKDLANANVNNTKKFADQQQAMSGLVRTYAITAANIFALSAAYNVLRENANLDILTRSSEQLSRTTGINFANVGKSLRDITDGALGVKESMQAATLGLSGGASVEQLKQITEIATKAAHALGRSVPDSVTRMVQAVTKGEPELVDEFGIILRLTVATDEYARSVGKASSELNTMEKQQAILQQLIKQGNSKFADVSLTDNTNQFDKLATTIQTMAQNVTSFVSGPLSALFGELSKHTGVLGIALTLIASTLIKQIIPSFHSMGESFGKSALDTVTRTKAATQELTNYHNFRRAKQEEEHDKILSNTAEYKKAQDTLKTTFPGAAVIQGATTPGQTVTRARQFIDTEALKRQIETATDATKMIGVRVGETTEQITRAQAVSVVQILGTARTRGEQEIGTLKTKWNIAWESMQDKTTAAGQKIQETIASIAGVGARTSAAVGQAFSGQTIAGGRLALEDARKAKIIDDQNRIVSGETTPEQLNSRWAKAGNGIVAVAGNVATGIRLIGAATNFILAPLAVLTSLYFAGSLVIDWLELIPKASSAATAKIEELSDSFGDLEKSVNDANEKLALSEDNMADLVAHYELLGNKTREIGASITEATKALGDIGGSKFQNSIGLQILGLDTGTKQVEALKLIIKQVDLLAKLTKEPIDLTVNIKGKPIDIRASVDNLTNVPEEERVLAQEKITYEIERRQQKVRELEGDVKDLNSAVTTLNKSWQDQTTQFRRANPLAIQIDATEDLIKGFKRLTAEGKGLEAELSIIEGIDIGKAKSLHLDVSKVPELKSINAINNFLTESKGKTPDQAFLSFQKMILDGKLVLTNLKEIEKVLQTINKMGTAGPSVLGELAKASAEARENIGDTGAKNLAALEKDSAKTKEMLNQMLTINNRIDEVASKKKVADTEAAKGGEPGLEGLNTSIDRAEELNRLYITQKLLLIDIATSRQSGLEKGSLEWADKASEISKYNAEILVLATEQKTFTQDTRDAKLSIQGLTGELAKLAQARVDLGIGLLNIDTEEKSSKLTEDMINRRTAILDKIAENDKLSSTYSKQILDYKIKIGEVEQDYNAIQASGLGISKLNEESAKNKAKTLAETIELEKKAMELRDSAPGGLNEQRLAAAKSKGNLGLASSISSNDKFDPEFRAKAMTLETALLRTNLEIELKLIDTEIEKNNILKQQEESRGKTKEALDIQLDTTNKLLEKEKLRVAASEQQYDNIKKQNEIDKLLVDKGLKDFNSTFKVSMGIAANDFAKSLGTSVDRAVKQVIGTIDATLDTTFSNFKDFLSGAKTGKEALAGIQDDMSNFFIDTALTDVKNTLKSVFLGAFGGGDIAQFATPVEKTAHFTELIYEEIKGGGTGLTKAAGIVPGSSGGLGGNMFKDIGNWASSAWSWLKDAVGGIGDSIGGWFSDTPHMATGGIVYSSTFANIGESGAEAVIPLSGGAVPVQISGDSSTEATKALIAVSQKMRDIAGTGKEQIASLQMTNLAINTMSDRLVTQMVIDTDKLITAMQGGTMSGGSKLAASILAGAQIIGQVAGVVSSAYNSGGGGSYGSDTVAGDVGSFNGGNSTTAYAEGGIVDRPTRAMIGEGRNNEAVVPLPNNRSIPVQFMDSKSALSDTPINISVNVLGVRDEGGLNRSANQIALESARAAQRALRRDG